MARFATDADVSPRLAHLLAANGHDVATAAQLGLTSRGQGLPAASDAVCLLVTAQQDRILITHNGKDYLLLHRAWLRWPVEWSVQPRPQHAGILVLPHDLPRQYDGYLIQQIVQLIAAHPSLTNELHALRQTGWVQLP